MAVTRWTQETYLETYRFAAEAHLGQLFPGTQISYLMHLSMVAMEVIAALREEPGRDEELAVQCALLHDVVEDTGVGLDEVDSRFGQGVAAGVSALTKSGEGDKSVQMADSLARIRKQPSEVWMVKLADRITNLQPPPPYWTAVKCASYQAEARVILKALGGASVYMAARLQKKIDDYDRHIAAAPAWSP